MSEQVQLGSSTVTVSITPGASAKVTAKVQGSPAGNTVSGTVHFLVTTKSGSSVSCTGGNAKVLSSSAKATCSLSALLAAKSPYSVSVTYAGNAYFGPSVSTTKKFNG
jgi:hypothetical protein